MPEEATRHLQQLLLEGVANGSVAGGADVERLVCSTFAAHQQARRAGSVCLTLARFLLPSCLAECQQSRRAVTPQRLPPSCPPARPRLQGRPVMAQASRAALRELMNEKRLVQWAAGEVRERCSRACTELRVRR